MKRERRNRQRPARARNPRNKSRALIGGLAGGAAIAMDTPGYAVPVMTHPGGSPIEVTLGSERLVDVDGDAISDLRFWLDTDLEWWTEGSWEAGADTLWQNAYIIGGPGDFVDGFDDLGVTRRFSMGDRIGPGGTAGPLYPYTDLGYDVTYGSPPFESYYGGQFVNNAGFMGFTFQIGLDMHWGWAEVEVVPGMMPGKADPLIRIFGWGYDDEPGVGVDAGMPEPGTLAALAIGAAAVAGGRRRKS